MTERLREDLDTFAEEHGYTGRSEVIRESCQSLLEEYQEVDYEDRRVLATVTAIFGYDEPEIERRMMDIRDEFEGAIRSNSHNCLRETPVVSRRSSSKPRTKTFPILSAPFEAVFR